LGIVYYSSSGASNGLKTANKVFLGIGGISLFVTLMYLFTAINSTEDIVGVILVYTAITSIAYLVQVLLFLTKKPNEWGDDFSQPLDQPVGRRPMGSNVPPPIPPKNDMNKIEKDPDDSYNRRYDDDI